MKIGNLYEIEWYDHFATTDTEPEKANEMEMCVISYGKLLCINKRYLVLATKLCEDCPVNNDNIHIMRKVIKRMKELK